MKKKIYIVVSVVVAFLIISGVMLSMKMNNKNMQSSEKIGKTEEKQEEGNIQALETEPQVPETWDLNKVYPVLSEDNIYVPVPKGWTISTDENERYVNGNVTKKGTISNLTFTSTGDYPWTQNSDNIWVSGNKGVASSTSELISNEIEVGENGGWVEIEWSVSSQLKVDCLSMTITDTMNGTSEIVNTISGKANKTSNLETLSNLVYIRCGKELSAGKYRVSIKYQKNNSTNDGLDSGYVKNGAFMNYDENGTNTETIHKASGGGFVIYEGEEAVANTWEASKSRNQFVWVPVKNVDRIREKNSETGPMKAKIYDFIDANITMITQTNGGGKREPGVLNKSYNQNTTNDTRKQLLDYLNLQDYSKDIFYKELHLEFENSMKSIEKYGGFYIGRYETGNISKVVPVVKRMNTDISSQTWYTMYNKMKNISQNSNVQTSMIWGCLWDETLQWIIDTEEKNNSDIAKTTSGSTLVDDNNSYSWGNYYGASFQYYDSNGELVNTKSSSEYIKIPTGSAEYTKANNIYDLAGNVWDGTLESSTAEKRIFRGGGYHRGWGGTASMVNDPKPASSRITLYESNEKGGNCGFRAYMYVK